MTNKSDKPDQNSNPETPVAETEQPDTHTTAAPGDDSTSSATESPTSESLATESLATESSAVESTATESEVRQAKPGLATHSSDTATASKSSSPWPARAALVIALAALGLSGYLFYQNQQLQNKTVSLAAEVETRLASNATEVARTVSSVSEQAAGINQQLGQLKEQTAASQRNVDSLQQRLTQSIRQVQAQQVVSEKDWLLAEAEYLLRLANQRVLMEQSATGALALLRSADEILQQADDAALYPVREALAEDIAALDAVPRLDTEGVFLRLSALNARVSDLRMTPVTDRRQLPDMLEEITPEAVRDTWGAGAKNALSSAMSKLDQLVVIQHRDDPVEPLLSPEQTYYLQQNLHLMLEQAQHALLQRRQGAYSESLEKASRWIADYFEPSDATTQSLLRGLDELKAVEVAPEVPSINASLDALQTHISELRRLKREGGN
ncbi:uroporphyrinogen-III C-methyltransferase [Nitrincola iocasae]|uniref:Heme biosynthesis protein n=1 Tax=Nitrincola iocasae TaxID=2614693 RepID=A0A5J6L9K0_9GAMM|nr:uroporphyrinogen-III C-methyltransferase [Nitrincola iocasae]QEW05185.1 heme biosynthesis protein [Nitrincola iocasae]